MNGFQKKVINKALDDTSILDIYEFDFVRSMADKPGDYELSERQNATLNRISQKVYR